MSIYDATLSNCITYQNDAARATRFARDEMYYGRMSKAIEWQTEAAFCADQARLRLDRLNGHS